MLRTRTGKHAHLPKAQVYGMSEGDHKLAKCGRIVYEDAGFEAPVCGVCVRSSA